MEKTIRQPRKIRLTEKAKLDLAEIWSYLADEASESVAGRLLRRFEGRFNQLSKLPLSGASRRQLADDLRVTFCERYAIYYLARADELVVVRILHVSRDVDAIADEGGFAL